MIFWSKWISHYLFNFFWTAFVTSFFPSFKKKKHFLTLIEAKGWLYWKCPPYMIKDSIGIIIFVTILLHWLWLVRMWILCGQQLMISCEKQSFFSPYQMMKVPLECCVIFVAYGYVIEGNLWRFQYNHFHYKTQSCKVDNQHVLFFFFWTLIVALHILNSLMVGSCWMEWPILGVLSEYWSTNIDVSPHLRTCFSKFK